MRNTDYNDKNYRRCKLCGMPLKIDREHFSGRMNITPTISGCTMPGGTIDLADITMVLTDDAATLDMGVHCDLSKHKGEKITITDTADVSIVGYIKSINSGTTVNIVSTPGGSTYSWESKGIGFNESDTEYDYEFDMYYPVVNGGCWFCGNSNDKMLSK